MGSPGSKPTNFTAPQAGGPSQFKKPIYELPQYQNTPNPNLQGMGADGNLGGNYNPQLSISNPNPIAGSANGNMVNNGWAGSGIDPSGGYHPATGNLPPRPQNMGDVQAMMNSYTPDPFAARTAAGMETPTPSLNSGYNAGMPGVGGGNSWTSPGMDDTQGVGYSGPGVSTNPNAPGFTLDTRNTLIGQGQDPNELARQALGVMPGQPGVVLPQRKSMAPLPAGPLMNPWI